MLINLPLGFVEHPHRPDPLPLLRSVLLLILGPLATVAAHRHDLATVGQRAQRGIEESAAHGGQHPVDASTIRQSEQRCSDVLCGVVHTRFGAQLPTSLHTLIGACAGENSGP